MKMRGAQIVVKALEDEGVRFTFGIPGTHNVELYDALEDSGQIEPVLVTDEQSASFMADAVSRTTDHVGVVNVVPGAGVTHCLSGVAEAWMDNVPMVVLTCGMRTDTGKAFQLHDIDQLAVLRPVTKQVIAVRDPGQMYSSVRRAFRIARQGAPGPVAVEIPVNLFLGTYPEPRPGEGEGAPEIPRAGEEELARAADMIERAEGPAMYLGAGAVGAGPMLVELAEKGRMPVCTTIQGKGVFPESHPLWLWNGFGASAPRFVRKIMDGCDCLLAIGCRFGEVATASYGLTPPENLIHVDIERGVLGRNYPARLAVCSDAAAFVRGLVGRMPASTDRPDPRAGIAAGHHKIKKIWRAERSPDRVTPAAFFSVLQRLAGPDTVWVTDSGNGTFLAMEHLRLDRPGRFIAPVDFSCMGYSVPAAIAAKMATPGRDVVALSGDGALLMTGLELMTAAANSVGPVVCVLRDLELAQIVQLQRTAYNRDTCSVLAPFEVEDLARTTSCRYLCAETDADLEPVLDDAFAYSRRGAPVVVEIRIDYSRKTYFTKGVITTNFWRLSWAERLRMGMRAATRRLKKD